jgi:hypothetical protein
MAFEMALLYIGKNLTGIVNWTDSFALVRVLKSGIHKHNLKQRPVMMTDRLGKWLFPRLQPYRQKREIKTLMAALGVGLFVAGIITAILILVNSAGN